MDQRYHEAFKEFRQYIDVLSQLDMNQSRPDIEHFLKTKIAVSQNLQCCILNRILNGELSSHKTLKEFRKSFHGTLK